MTPIIAVFMSMISLLALVADRANLQEQTLSVQGEAIPLPSVDDGVSRNFLDVAKRTLPLKMTPARTISMRRVPRAAAAGPGPAAPAPDVLDHVLDLQEDILLQSLLIHALRKRDIREQLFGSQITPTSTSTGRPRVDPHPRSTLTPRTKAPYKGPPKGPSKGSPKGPSKGPPKGPNSLGELRDNLMVHGRDRDQLRRRWKIQDAGNRVANVHG